MTHFKDSVLRPWKCRTAKQQIHITSYNTASQ